jgi:hypothetical protein
LALEGLGIYFAREKFERHKNICSGNIKRRDYFRDLSVYTGII